MLGRLSRVLLLSAVVSTFGATPALCGGSESGVTVVKIYASVTSGLVDVETSATSDPGAPSCYTNTPWPVAYKTLASNGNPNGAANLATTLFLGAFGMGTTVRIDGAGTCTATGVNEDLADVIYGD